MEIGVVEDEGGAQRRRPPAAGRGERAHEVRQGEEGERTAGQQALAQQVVGPQLVRRGGHDVAVAGDDPGRRAVDLSEHRGALDHARGERRRRGLVQARTAQWALEERAVGEIEAHGGPAAAFAAGGDQRGKLRASAGVRCFGANADERVEAGVLARRARFEGHRIQCFEGSEQARAGRMLAGRDDADTDAMGLIQGRGHWRCSLPDKRAHERPTCV